MGVRNYMQKRRAQKEEEQKSAKVAYEKLEELQNWIKFDEHLRDLDELEKQVILEERIKKLKAKQQK